MNQKSNSFLETEPLGKLMKKYAVPCIISLLVAALYNIVDQIFIANATYLGSYGNAANTVILATVNKATFIYLQSLGKALVSTMLSMVREVVFGVGFALILPIFFGLDGVLYSMPVSDVLTFVISVIVIIYTYRTLNDNKVKEKTK